MAEYADSAGPLAVAASSTTLYTAPAVAAISQTNATTTNASNKVTVVTPDDRWVAGMSIEGSANIPAATKIIGKNTAGTELYLSANATGSSATVTITGYQNAIVRKLTLCNVTNSAANISVGKGTANTDAGDATGKAKRLISEQTVADGRSLIEEGFTVLRGGATPQLVYAIGSTASAFTADIEVVVTP